MQYEYPEKTPLMKQIEREISDYTTRTVNLGENINYSQHKLVRRIVLFESKTYPTGKFDSQGNYKYWFDIQSPLIDSEVKNVDFDTKNIEVYTPFKLDETPNLIVNLKLNEWMRENGQAEEINSSIEEGASWGNIVWKKIRGSYERMDLRNFYVINQAAKSLKESPVIEYHPYNQTQVREMSKQWKNVDQVLSKCGSNFYKRDDSSTEEETTTPYYSIYERNGEVNLRDLKEQRIKLGFEETIEKGDSEKYVLAKVISAGTQNNNGAVKIRYVMFADEITKMPYKEYHRGRYKGRWFREGIYELTFDIQVRCSEIGNQLARGLEWASKQVFYSPDKLVIQNIISDLKNGDIIRASNLAHVPVRMEGFDQLVAEWNRLTQMARDLTNSREIVQGDDMPAGMPFRMGALLNVNANKLYDFIREKIAIPLSEIFGEEVVPGLVDDLKASDVLRLTGDSDMLNRMYQLVVDNWYVKNLIAIGAHSPEVAELIKQKKLEDLKKDKTLFLSEFKQMFENYKPRVAVVITGENVDLPEKLQTLATFISMESDPVRRSYLIEKAMRLKGIDVGALPRSTPEQLMGVKPEVSSLMGAGASDKAQE